MHSCTKCPSRANGGTDSVKLGLSLWTSTGRSSTNSQTSMSQLYFSTSKTATLNARFNAKHGHLITSLARNSYEREDFASATNILRKWQTPCLSSLFELSVVRKITTFRGLIELKKGQYHAAKDLFEIALKSHTPAEECRYDIFSYLSDVYCDLGKPLKALNLLRPHVEAKDVLNRLHLGFLRNLMVSYAEASVCAGQFQQAEHLLSELNCYFDGVPPSILTR